MNQIGKLQQVESKIMKYNLDILAISETRCNGIGMETLAKGNIYMFSGGSDGVGRERVGMMMTQRAENLLIEWRAVNSKLLIAKFKSRQCNISIIVFYAPTNDPPEEKIDKYDEELQSVIDEIPERYMKIVIGDFNAKVGKNNQWVENMMVGEGLGEVSNENEAHFISLYSTNNVFIGDTVSEHKNIHKYTWTSPCSNYKNQIDHSIINEESRRTMKIARSCRAADIGCDHQLLIATLKLKLKAPNRNVDRIPRFDTTKLLEEKHREKFEIGCRI
ncbi:craniofacial development protein 2-like [Palaemon carinicauda]|uniref:craniofacial development protein 2-like n=1 Tax=Palaemon carinicauda TaxID=392227 RepID=UPI0035B5A18F